jgi:transposase
VLGATSVLRHARDNKNASKWVTAILTRRPYKVAAVALANKMARIIWALLTKGRNLSKQGSSRRRKHVISRLQTD